MRCARCGIDGAPGAAFCSGCGAPLAPPASATRAAAEGRGGLSRRGFLEERKQVTVLFADVKGSMELISHRDPEEARTLLDPVLQVMMDCVHRYEGTVNQVMGDGVMALFGAPVAHEDHAIRACCAALEMQQRVERLSEELERARGTTVAIRIGLNSGEVVLRAIESDVHADYTAVGQATHLAARMEQVAAPGTILVTGGVLDLAGGAIDVKPRGHVAVKGLAQSVDAYELVGVRSNRAGFAALATRLLTPFVGRDAELEALERALQEARRGRGQVVALVGEPGVGKSRLVRELVHSPRTDGWRVLSAAALSYGKSTVYQPVAGLLKDCFAIQDHDDTATIRDKVGHRSQSPAPFLDLLQALPDDSPFARIDPARRRRETIEAVTGLLQSESAVQPLLVIVEDLHWLDAGSQGVLDALVERLPAARLVLLVTYRPEYRHGWGAKSYYTQLPIDALSSSLADELLHALLGGEPELQPLRRLLVEQSEGNPFFLEESVRTLVEERSLLGARGAYRLARPVHRVQVPATVQAVLAARIDRLPPEEKALLQSAAVIGKDVPGPLLEAIADQPAERVRQGVARLRAGEFLYEVGLFPEVKYTFKHALTHEVAYGSLLRERRRALHARIVAAIEELHGDRLSDHVERLAYHAVHGEQWATALGYLRQAGARAFTHSAHKVAVGWFEQALAVLERMPEEATREVAIDLRLDLRYALTPLGQFKRIHEVLREAERLAAALGDRRRLGVVSSFLTNYFQVMGDLQAAVDYGRRALDIATAERDADVEIVATAYLSLSHQTLGDLPRAVEHARRCIARVASERVLERLGMAILPAVYARTALVRALAELGDFAEGTSVGLEGIRIAEEADHAYSLHFACLGLGALHLRQGDATRAVSLLERAHDLCRVADAPAMLAHVAAFLGSAYSLAGRLGDALAVLERAQLHASAIGLPGSTLGHALRLMALGEAHLLSGDATRAAEIGREALEHFRRLRALGYQAWGLRLLAAATARTPARAEAEGLFERALALADSLGMRPLRGQCLLELAAVRHEAGRRDTARAAVAAALDVFGSMDAPAWRARAERRAAEIG